MVERTPKHLEKRKMCSKCQTILPAGENRKRIWNQLLCSCCFEAELSKIEDPVERARIRFELLKKHGNSKIALNFDELMKLYANDCNTFIQIAGPGEVSRERIRWLYQTIFADITPGRPDGTTRRKVCTRKRDIKRVDDAFKCHSRFTLIAKKAMKIGYKIKPVFIKEKHGRDRTGFSKIKLSINGCLVKIARIKRQRRIGKRIYFPLFLHIGSTIKATEFVIGVVGEESRPKIYIIPIKILLELSRGRSSFHIFIPTEKLPPYHNIRPRVDWWQYLDAWHLLKQ